VTPRPRLPVVIGGPTASGKSALALALAEEFEGELICGDSRQVYAGMRIAAAGPSDDERARVPHHLYGEIDPRTTMTAGAWAARADEIVDDILARGRLPLIVGGTGLYLRAWRVGLEEPSDPAVRARLDDEAERLGAPVLHARLAHVDPEAAAAIEPGDRLRVVRALEIVELKGGPRGARDLAALPPRREALWLLVDAPLDVLEPRIRARAEHMFASGIVEESAALAALLDPGHRLLETLGTEEAVAVRSGTLTVDDAVAKTALRTRQYARRQRTWFKKEPWWTRLDAASPSIVEDARTQLRGHLLVSRA
jgi:tRNA dimethylallyltransferase